MSRVSVLIVDDEPDLLDIVSDEVKTLNFTVYTAGNGKEALDFMERRRAAHEPVDAILSDINMPMMNGLEFLKNLRERGFDTPFVFFSGYGDKEKTIQALRWGAYDFLEKPYDSERLLHTVKDAGELGASYRQLTSRLDQLIAQASLPEEQKQEIKKIQHELFVLKKACYK